MDVPVSLLIRLSHLLMGINLSARHKPLGERPRRDLAPRAEAQFVKNVLHMVFSRALGEMKKISYRAVCQAAPNEAGDLSLPMA